ncbi:MAG TPA: glycosyltransferase [Myxococcota bacterium]|nr:glycosyltransferase [Myxococcota bacterium]
MRLLALTPRLPYPPVGGDKLRAYEFLARLSARHEIHLCSFVADQAELEHGRALQARHPSISLDTVVLPVWRSRLNTLIGVASALPLQVHYYRSRRMRALVARTLAERRFDAVYVHLLRMAQYVERAPLRRVLDITDAISLVYDRARAMQRGAFRPIFALEVPRLRRYETRLVRAFDATAVISDVDRDVLAAKGAPAERLELVNNGVDRQFFAPRAESYDIDRLVFVGNLSSFANTDAAEHMLRDIFPRVRALHGKATLYVVGVSPPASVRAYDGVDGVTVTGAVDDVRPYVERAAASLCPVRVAGGVQNKILESLALGVPVVTSPEGFEGLGARGEEDGVCVAASPDEFARQALALMRDGARRSELGRRGTRFVAQHYDWERQTAVLERLLFP